MTSPSMNHEQAVKSLATERYLLGEMTDEERRAFEEHYLDCADCLEAVTFGDEFLSAGGEHVATHRATALAAAPASPWREKLAAIFKPLLSPVPALAVMAALIASIGYNAYQVSRVRSQEKTIAELKAPRQELRFQLRPQARAGGSVDVLRVPRQSQLRLEVEFTPDPSFSGYVVELKSDSGDVSSFRSDGKSNPVVVSVPAEALKPGRHTIVVSGLKDHGVKKEAGNGIFDLQFSN